MNCRELAEFLSDYVDGELPADVRARFDEHLGECETCRVYLATFRQTLQLAREAHGADDAPTATEMPEALVRAILAASRAAE